MKPLLSARECWQGSARVSVVVPCFNEAATVRELLRRLRSALPHSQVIVVDDGSTDGSSDEIRSVAGELRLETCFSPTNQGKGAAFRAGLARADREFVVIQDADLEYDPGDIMKLLSVALSGDWDAVYGSRYLSQGRRRGGSYWNYLAVRCLSCMLWLKQGLRLSDPATCYKLIRRDRLQAVVLRSDGFELCQELNRAAAEQHWRVVEQPIGYRPRSRADGKKIRAVDFWFALRTLLERSACIMLMAVLGALFLQAGCDRFDDGEASIAQAPTKSGISSEKLSIVWDCGVVLPGETTRISFPLDLPGVTSARDISSIETSCECVQVSLSDLKWHGSGVLAFIHIDRSDEEQESDRIQQLHVTLSFTTYRGECHEATIHVTLL